MIAAMNMVPEAYRGLDRFAARKRVVADITAEGNAVMIPNPEFEALDEFSRVGIESELPFVENKKIMQPFGDRSKVVIEPKLTDQWFCDAEPLAKPATAAVREGRTEFVPKTWENTYFNWMDNIQPWCISRQLWWGHRIPVWYGPKIEADDHETVFANLADLQNTQATLDLVPFCAASFDAARHQAMRY